MKLLDGKLYDPSTAVTNKATTAGLALTAFDTTNLRLTVSIPKSGKILVRIGCQVHGATTLPAVILGVLEGSTVRGRRAPMVGGGNLAATGIYSLETEFLITGLTPGNNITLDAAYGVETGVASTNIKYGGPNDTTTNNNFGGFAFELWDPDPYNVDASGNVQADVREVNGTAQTAGDICARLPAALVGGRMDSSIGAVANGVIAAASFAANALDAVWSTATRLLTAGTNIVLAKGTGITGFNDLDAAGVRGAVGLAAANLDTQLGALPAGVRAEIDANSTKLDVAVSTRLAAAGYTAPDNAGIAAAGAAAAAAAADTAAIKTKTDELAFTVPGKLDVNVLVVNGITIGGAGTPGNPWGPA